MKLPPGRGINQITMNKVKNVDEYIKLLPAAQAEAISQIRAVVRKTAPLAEEQISYGMPAYKLNGKVLIYFAAFSHHIGVYPLPSGIAQFSKELSKYKQGKGSVQFPLSEPMPLRLIEEMVRKKVLDYESNR